jgi:hypothetical protein
VVQKLSHSLSSIFSRTGNEPIAYAQKYSGKFGVHKEGGLVLKTAAGLLYFAVPLSEPAAPGLYRE